MTTILASDLLVGHRYKLANTLHIVTASNDYIQRLSRPHLLLSKDVTIRNHISLSFQTDGTGEYPTVNPQIWVLPNQEFLNPEDPEEPPRVTTIGKAPRKGGKRTAKRKQNHHKCRIYKRKSTNRRK